MSKDRRVEGPKDQRTDGLKGRKKDRERDRYDCHLYTHSMDISATNKKRLKKEAYGQKCIDLQMDIKIPIYFPKIE